VITLAVGQAEQTFLQYGIPAVPECSAKQRCCRSSLMPASPSRPNGRRASGLVVAEIVPGVSILAVVFAHSAPLPLAEYGPHFFHGVLQRELLAVARILCWDP